MACANQNLQFNQFNTSFEDRASHLKVVVEIGQPVSYGDCFEVANIHAVENKYNNQSSFDYQRYLKSKSIFNTADATKLVSHNDSLINFVKNKRLAIINQNCTINQTTCPYINSLIFGDKSIDDYQKSIYGQIGIAPIFAISGMHITIIYDLLIYWLSKMRIVIQKANIISISLLLIYSIFAGSSVAVNRALLMVGMKTLFTVKALDGLLIAFMISIIFNPYNLLNNGYLLSYIITFGIITFPRFDFSRNWLNPLALSSSCYLLALPLSYHYSYSFNLLAPLAMIVFVPMITLVLMPIGLIASIFPIQLIENLLVLVIDLINSLAAGFNLFTIYGGHITSISWLIFIAICFRLYKEKYKALIYLLLWFVFISLDITIYPTITFIDVGQGDSALVETMGNDVLIDVGNTSDEVVNQVRYSGINQVDQVFISHAHLDHYGALSEISQYLDIDQVYELQGNQIIKDSVGISEFYSSEHLDVIPYYGTNDNDRELIVKFKFEHLSFLFPGDVELESEDYLVKNYCQELNSDVIKVPHHGSKTSSSPQFLDCVSPEVAVISSGRHNMYKHPSDEVVERYNDISQVYNTQDEGEIKFKVKGQKLKK